MDHWAIPLAVAKGAAAIAGQGQSRSRDWDGTDWLQVDVAVTSRNQVSLSTRFELDWPSGRVASPSVVDQARESIGAAGPCAAGVSRNDRMRSGIKGTPWQGAPKWAIAGDGLSERRKRAAQPIVNISEAAPELSATLMGS